MNGGMTLRDYFQSDWRLQYRAPFLICSEGRLEEDMLKHNLLWADSYGPLRGQ